MIVPQPDSTETEYSEAPEDPEDVVDDEPEDVADDEPEHSEDAPEHTPKTRSEAEDDAATG